MAAQPVLSTTQLPPGYYLWNFSQLLEHVADQYSDLLTTEEKAFRWTFASLSLAAQRLLVRMLMRKGNLFRAEKLVYDEIGDPLPVAKELEQVDLIDINPSLPLGEVLGLFSKAEWIAKLPLNNELASTLRRAKREQLNVILQTQLAGACTHVLVSEPLFRLRIGGLFEVFKLLFFGHLRHDLSDFVVRDLGHVRYERYAIDRHSRLFTNRQQIEQHLQYFALVDRAEVALTSGRDAIVATLAAVPEVQEFDNTLRRRVQRLQVTLARQLERLGHLQDALTAYERCVLPPARERRARILAKLGLLEQALGLCREIEQQPLTEEEEVFACRFGMSTARKLGLERPAPASHRPRCDSLQLACLEPSVEVAVLNQLAGDGPCFYVENGLFGMLFLLHYWKVIFAPVRGAFTHPFQAAPHDLYESDFLRPRQALLAEANERLNTINDRCEHYIALWQEKRGTAAPFAAWEAVDERLIRLALERIPAYVWQCVFARFWRDLKSNRSGLPDLVHFPISGGFELIEVKGPGDRLQANQQRWMAYFERHHVPHRVIQVVQHG